MIVQSSKGRSTSGDYGYFTLTFRDEEDRSDSPSGASAGDGPRLRASRAWPLIGQDALNQPNVSVTGTGDGRRSLYDHVQERSRACKTCKQHQGSGAVRTMVGSQLAVKGHAGC